MSIDGFLKTVNLLPEPILLVSGGGTILAVNRGLTDRLGPDARGIAGRRLADLTADPPEDVARYLRSCSRTRSLVMGTIRWRLADASIQTCRVEGCVYEPRTAEQEAVLLLRMTPHEASSSQFSLLNRKIDDQAQEIRKRRQAEEELREQKEWLRVTLSSIGDAVIASDIAGRVTYMNPVAEQLTGWPLEEASGQPMEMVFRIINEESRLPVESPVDKVLRDGKVVGLANHTILISRQGEEHSIDDAAAPIREGDRETRGVVLVFHDIGDRRAMERELRERSERLIEADRRKDEFLAMLAHELRNPLAPALNALRVLRAPNREDADVEWATDIMVRQMEHMARLVDDLLDISRIVHGKIELKPGRRDLREIVRHAVDATGPLLAGRGQSLTSLLPPDPLPVDVDPDRIQQVLANLLNNASKYTDPGGHIRVEATRQEGTVQVRVRDEGIGIAPELLPHVFDLFVQADRSLARSQGGLGIGLTLVQTLVKLHGGRVSIHSDGLGQGTEVSVILPIAAAEETDGEGPSSAGGQAVRAPRRVLVVDDNIDSAQTLARLLARWGHDVRVAFDGPTALQEARSLRPEVVLLDIGLPGMDGYQVARHLRAEVGSSEDAYLVALTGYGQPDDRLRSQEAGFDKHLIKPVDFKELKALLGHPGL